MPKPTAAANAAPLSKSSHHMMLLAYAEWLHNERSILCHLMGWDDRMVAFTEARRFHYPKGGVSWQDVPPPSARAVAVMDVAGVDLAAIRAWAQRAAITGRSQDGFEVEAANA